MFNEAGRFLLHDSWIVFYLGLMIFGIVMDMYVFDDCIAVSSLTCYSVTILLATPTSSPPAPHNTLLHYSLVLSNSTFFLFYYIATTPIHPPLPHSSFFFFLNKPPPPNFSLFPLRDPLPI